MQYSGGLALAEIVHPNRSLRSDVYLDAGCAKGGRQLNAAGQKDKGYEQGETSTRLVPDATHDGDWISERGKGNLVFLVDYFQRFG